MIDKWYIDLLVLRTLTGGGQRPQSYARVRWPTSEEIEDWSKNEKSGSVSIEIYTHIEKTARALVATFVVCPDFQKGNTKFHVDDTVEIMRSRNNIVLSAMEGVNPLLIYSRTNANFLHQIFHNP